MQIRLTVLGPRSAHPGRSGHHPAPASAPHALMGAVDVLVTAPVGTALASVAGGLADAVAAAGYEAGGGSSGGGAVVLYAGGERLDPQRCALGEPPLVDGAVLSLHTPADPDSGHYPGYPGLPETAVADATVHLDVVAGPDAGGVHLLHGGQVRIGRSADADVPLDDPDVSRLHCAVTVAEDGRVTIADLGSTNGTAADGVPVGTHPVPLEPGALLRIGESALRLRVPSADSAFPSAPSRLPVHADGEGHLRVTPAGDHPTHAEGPWTGAPQSAPPTPPRAPGHPRPTTRAPAGRESPSPVTSLTRRPGRAGRAQAPGRGTPAGARRAGARAREPPGARHGSRGGRSRPPGRRMAPRRGGRRRGAGRGGWQRPPGRRRLGARLGSRRSPRHGRRGAGRRGRPGPPGRRTAPRRGGRRRGAGRRGRSRVRPRGPGRAGRPPADRRRLGEPGRLSLRRRGRRSTG
ncbi:FHA domain-containing protein [Streptomyces antimycoticus]|nr:FHA domain-containing protein [Streptomyces antimycoticus]